MFPLELCAGQDSDEWPKWAGWLAGWLARWLAGSLAGWLAGWLARWLAAWTLGGVVHNNQSAVAPLSAPSSTNGFAKNEPCR